MVWKACYCTMPPYDQRQSWKILRLCLTLAYSALNDASCTQRHSCVRSHINSHSKNKIKEKKSLTSCIQQQLVKCRKKKKKKVFSVAVVVMKSPAFLPEGKFHYEFHFICTALSRSNTHTPLTSCCCVDVVKSSIGRYLPYFLSLQHSDTSLQVDQLCSSWLCVHEQHIIHLFLFLK